MALMVGVSGIRGLVGDTLTPRLVLEFGQAFGTLLGGGRVVLGRDTRTSGAMYASAAAAGLIAAGCEVTDLGIAMTPTVGFEILRGGYAGGLILTASHNPEPWNGIKTLDELGLAPDVARAARLAEIRERGEFHRVKTGFHPLRIDIEAGERHIDAVLDAVEVDLRPLHGTKVVLDSVNGAGCLDTPRLLHQLGCDVIHINGEPTGHFAHTPEPLAENLTQLCDAVRENRAAVGFAQDPDADRLALVDEHGRFIGEEYTLALATLFVLQRRPGPVAANLSTSRRVDDLAARFGQRVIRTPVGEAHVARAMLADAAGPADAKVERASVPASAAMTAAARGKPATGARAVIGGEGNGGVIDPRISMVRDSAAAISLVLQLMASSGKSLSALVREIPNYVMIKRKAECDLSKIKAAVEAVATQFTATTAGPSAAAQVNRSDGIRIDFPEGWVHLRASNTEPIFRVIAEAADEATAERLIRDVRAAAGL